MVRVTIDGGVAVVTMADPSRHNALGEEMVRALTAHFEAAGADPAVRVIVLAGDDDTFSAGAPRELLARFVAGDLQPTDIVLPRALLGCPVPVIAAMAGHATGGGFALGLAADVVVMAEESRYGFTFMNMGFTPGMGTTRLCEHVLAPAIAHELLYSGELRRGSSFAGSGINHLVPRGQVMARAMDVALRIAAKPRPAIEMLKRVLSLPRRQAFEASLTAESLMHQITLRHAGATALIEDEYVE